MDDQLSLPRLSAQPTDRLFFAIFPPAEVAKRIEKIQRGLRAKHQLSGRLIAVDRLHVTLCHLGDYAGPPADVLRKAGEAADRLAAPPFEVMFDRAGSFSGRPRNRPLVLGGGEGVAGVEALQRALHEAMKRSGLGGWARPYTPHMTLLYDHRGVAVQAIEPVRWAVTEVTLVHSLLGRTQHVHLGRWALGAKAAD